MNFTMCYRYSGDSKGGVVGGVIEIDDQIKEGQFIYGPTPILMLTGSVVSVLDDVSELPQIKNFGHVKISEVLEQYIVPRKSDTLEEINAKFIGPEGPQQIIERNWVKFRYVAE